MSLDFPPLRALAAGLALTVLLADPLSAQQTATGASVTGRVGDPSGQLIAGATVVVRDEARNQVREAATDSRGRFQFLFLPVGGFDLTVSAPGFATHNLRLTLAIGQMLDLPITSRWPVW